MSNFIKVSRNGKDITHLTPRPPAGNNPTVSPTVSAEPWPILLLPLKLLAKSDDRGAGDIIAHTIGPIGGDAFKIWYGKTFGKSCGCGARQEVLNARWPL